jgi:hypothetical protein
MTSFESCCAPGGNGKPNEEGIATVQLAQELHHPWHFVDHRLRANIDRYTHAQVSG